MREHRMYKNLKITIILPLVVLAFAAACAGCTESQPQFELDNVMVYIAEVDEPGWVIVVPFYNLTHTGPEVANLTLIVTLVGSEPQSMNGYTFEPLFVDGLYQPPTTMGMNALDGEDATLRIRLTGDGGQLLEKSYVVELGNWPKYTWLLLTSAA